MMESSCLNFNHCNAAMKLTLFKAARGFRPSSKQSLGDHLGSGMEPRASLFCPDKGV